MQLAVFGATGRTGRRVVAQALEAGHSVTALARHPESLAPHKELRTVPGDVRSPEQVAAAVAGADAVISALGQRTLRGATVCGDGVRTILPAMDRHGVSRLLAVGAYGTGDSRHGLLPAALWVVIRPIMADKEVMERLLRESDVDWTVARPPLLPDGPPTGRYRTGTDLRLSGFPRVSTGDVADFLLRELTEHRFPRMAVTITS